MTLSDAFVAASLSVACGSLLVGCDEDSDRPGGGGPDGGDDGGDGGADGGPDGSRPHPLYPPLDLATLPGSGGAASGPYTPPALPTTSREVTVGTTGAQAGTDLMAACDTPGTAVDVPDAAGRIGVINIGNVEDCDITLGPAVVIDFLVVGSLPGPAHAPSHRVRIRGGQIGSVLVIGGSSDLVFDGVAINNGVVPSAGRSAGGIYMPPGEGPDEVVERFAVVRSFIRLVAMPVGPDLDGAAYLGVRARDVFFADNNVVTAGNRNSWGFRIGGGDNALIVDNTVRVSFHKFVRMNDNPVDYVYIKGGIWMREETLTSGGALLADSWAQLTGSTTDQVYVHDPVAYLMPDLSASFGAAIDAAQDGRLWEARRIEWHARSANAMDDAHLQILVDACAGVGAICDYGIGTHTYEYDPALSFPADPWRDLPTFDDDDPDNLPVEP